VRGRGESPLPYSTYKNGLLRSIFVPKRKAEVHGYFIKLSKNLADEKISFERSQYKNEFAQVTVIQQPQFKFLFKAGIIVRKANIYKY